MQDDKNKMNITKDMQSNGKKLQTIFSKKYEEIEMKIFYVNQSRERTLLEIEEMKIRNEMLQDRLRNIHDNYLSCVIFNNQHIYEEIRGKFEKLTIEQDNLKESLIECKRSKEENDKKIKELSITIEIEKKRNVALLRKLERASKMKNISQELRDKINLILTNKSSNEI